MGRLFFPSEMFKATSLAFFFYALISPPDSHLSLSLALFFSVVLVAASHNVLHSDFSLHFGNDVFVYVRGFVLSWIKGVELNKAWHLEVMRHMMRQGKQMQPPILPSSHIPTFQHTHTGMHKHSINIDLLLYHPTSVSPTAGPQLSKEGKEMLWDF